MRSIGTRRISSDNMERIYGLGFMWKKQGADLLINVLKTTYQEDDIDQEKHGRIKISYRYTFFKILSLQLRSCFKSAVNPCSGIFI
jgi:hypothetical protein